MRVLLTCAFAVAAARAATAAGASADNDAPVAVVPVARATPSLTLREALDFARAHQPSLQIALASVRAAQEQARVARAQWQPSFGATAQLLGATANNSTASYVSVPDLDLPRIGGTRVSSDPSWRPQASTVAAIGFDQEVFDFGRIGAQAAAADAATNVERLSADVERLRVDLVVRESYYAVLGAKAIQRAAEEAFVRARAHRDLAQAGVKSGLHAPIELTRAEADLTRFDVARVRALGGLRTAQTVLAAAIGAEDRMVDAADEQAVVAPVPTLEQALATLERRDPEIRRAQSAVAAQQALTRAAYAEGRPELFLSGTVSGRAGGAAPSSGPDDRFEGWVPDVPNWHAGIVLRWPLHDPVLSARARAQQSREAIATAASSAVRQEQIAALQGAYVTFDVARASLGALERATEAARANYAQAEARFRAGLGNSVELADAEAVRSNAELQAAIGQFEVWRARAVLARLLAED